jgi:homeodomain interacting protein kinase
MLQSASSHNFYNLSSGNSGSNSNQMGVHHQNNHHYPLIIESSGSKNNQNMQSHHFQSSSVHSSCVSALNNANTNSTSNNEHNHNNSCNKQAALLENSTQQHQPSNSHVLHQTQQTITISDSPSPPAVITISDSEDESADSSAKLNQSRPQLPTQVSCRSGYSCASKCSNVLQAHHSQQQAQSNQPSHPQFVSTGVGVISQSGSNCNQNNNCNSRQRKNVISCVTLGDSDGEESQYPRRSTPRTQNTGEFKQKIRRI